MISPLTHLLRAYGGMHVCMYVGWLVSNNMMAPSNLLALGIGQRAAAAMLFFT